ncbi:hypothetical protein AUP68_08589 [Ilyonectria robusta]
MLSLHCLVAICGFASAAHISESNLGDIIQHVGEPVGSEQVHDGGIFTIFLVQYL